MVCRENIHYDKSRLRELSSRSLTTSNRETEMKGMGHIAIRNLLAGAAVAVMIVSGCVTMGKTKTNKGNSSR